MQVVCGGAALLHLREGRGMTRLVVSGRLDVSCGQSLPEVLLSAARSSQGALALDLSGVEACDMAGAVTLAGACERARAAGYPVGLAAASPEMDRMMVLTGTLHLVADDIDAGPDAVGPTP